MGDRSAEYSKRLDRIPPYLFAGLDKLKAEHRARGVDVISLSIGDPDLPTPAFIVERMQEAVANPIHHQYPPYEGTKAFREAVARYYDRRFGVTLDPETEVLCLVGSKEGIAHVFLAFVDPGDPVLVPDPGYPVFKMGAIMAGGEPYEMPCLAADGFLPSYREVPDRVADAAPLLFLNYPGNPTAAVAPVEFFEETVAFARRRRLVVCHDNAYGDITYGDYRGVSFLQAKGAKEVGIEFGSLSKPYNMTGWRIGYAVGNARILKGLATIKNNIDSGTFTAVQAAGIAALDLGDPAIAELRAVYQRRRDVIVAGLNTLGWALEPPKASFYIWAPVPSGFTSTAFSAHLLERTGILVAPGIGYGSHGEGYFRISITLPEARIREAVNRMAQAGITGPGDRTCGTPERMNPR